MKKKKPAPRAKNFLKYLKSTPGAKRLKTKRAKAEKILKEAAREYKVLQKKEGIKFRKKNKSRR